MIVSDPDRPDTLPIDPDRLLALERVASYSIEAGVARSLVPSEELMLITIELRRLRSLALTRRDASAALWACRHARTQLEGALELGALDDAIGKLTMIEIVGPL